ncbi:hypothetical protein GCM10027277_57690 [Pseudoduganella ginsengisoli]|uniref:TraK n=2 Tax=Pseudoduganella ginsengisoli TaxID=1462440 RepID=A0A6L6Q7W5_9BURK|nr:hypothetical protein [Pseudoduganella ginsengisoli]
MPKTLSERIADRVTKQDKGATKKNRAIFLALRAEVDAAMKDGWPIKTIWETLHEERRVTFSYQAFRLYVNKLILQDGADDQGKQPGQVLPTAPTASAAGSVPPLVAQVSAAVPAEAKPPGPVINPTSELGGFNFNTKPQKESLI